MNQAKNQTTTLKSVAEQAPKMLVTGGAKRVGAALVRAAAEDGWNVFIHCHNNLDEAETLADELGKNHLRPAILQADLADAEACKSLMAAACADGPLDALINNASQFTYDQVDAFKTEDLASHMAVNVAAPAILIAEMATALGSAHKGVVINMLDAKLFGMNPDYFTYTLSKAALHTMSQMSAQYFAPNLRVNNIAPGITLPSGGQTEAEFLLAHKRNPLGQGADIAEIVAAMRLIVSAPSMTGHTIVLDGGAHLQPAPRDVAFLED